MTEIRVRLLRAGLRLILGLAILAAFLTLTVTGILWLAGASSAALAPVLGTAGAMATTAALCLAPVLLLIAMLWRSTRMPMPRQDDQPSLRALVRKNPWEAASLAFLLGVSWRTDPETRAALLKNGLWLIRDDRTEAARDTKPSSES